MDFVFSPEQETLRGVVRSLLELHADEAAVRTAMETESGYDSALWRRLAKELELQSLAIPVEFGGAGGGFLELAVVLEEFGRSLYCGPFFSSIILAAHTLFYTGDESALAKYLPGIGAGDTLATVAATELLTLHDPVTRPVARPTGTGFGITGSVDFVMDGHVADVFVVAADGDAGLGLFLLERGSGGLTSTDLPTMDRTRRFARVEFADAPGLRLGEPGNGGPIMNRVRNVAVAALAAEQVGGAQRMLDSAVGYAKLRTQFGRAIGSFQAIKHRCADMSIEVEGARSAAHNAAWQISNGAAPQRIEAAASVAHSYCSETFTRATASNIQIHGGVGFTWEHPAHLYYKRAKSSELLFGSPAAHRRRLAGVLGLTPKRSAG